MGEWEMGKEELEWMSKHEKEVEKYSGKWVAVLAKRGITGSGRSPKEAIRESKERFPERPMVMRVPRKDEEMYIL